MNARCGRVHERGWSTSEYLAVLLGLMTVWHGAQLVLGQMQRHHAGFSWALGLPF